MTAPMVVAMKATLDPTGVVSGANTVGQSLDGVRAKAGAAAAAAAAQAAASAKASVGAAHGVALQRHELTNLTYQMNDLTMMLASGQSPFIAMMQQGSQVAQIMGNRGLGEIIPALGAALRGLITPTTLLLGAMTAGYYGVELAIEAVRGKVADTGKSLEAHEAAIAGIKEAWGEAAKAVETYAARSPDVARARLSLTGDKTEEAFNAFVDKLIANREIVSVEAARIREELEKVQDAFSREPDLQRQQALYGEINRLSDLLARASTDALVAARRFEPFRTEIETLLVGIRNGSPDIEGFRNAVARMVAASSDGAIRQLGEELLDATEEGAKLAAALTAGAAAMDVVSPAARRAAADVKGFGEALAALAAISPRDLDDRARALEAYGKAVGSTGSARDRVAAGELLKAALARIDEAEARKRREQSASMMNDMAAEADRLRIETRLVGANDAARTRALAALAAEADIRRAGLPLHSAEAEALRAQAMANAELVITLEARTAALKQATALADTINKGGIEQARLKAEIALIGASSAERTKALALIEAEIRIRDLGLPIRSREADLLREQAKASAELSIELKAQADAWSAVSRAGESLIDRVVDRISDGDFEGALKAMSDGLSKTALELAVANPLKNWLFGSGLPTMQDIGPALARIGTGGSSANGAASAFAKALPASVGAMTVSAATVVVNGVGPSGLPGNLLGGGGASGMGGGIAEQAWSFFRGKGLAPHQAAAIIGHMKAESGFNPLATGDGGLSFGLFQHHRDRADNLLRHVGGKSGLSDVGKQLEFAWQELMTSERGAFSKLMSAGSLQDAVKAFGAFERPQGWSPANPEGMHNFSGRMAAAEEALGQFASTANQAQTGLSAFGNGLAQTANLFGGGGPSNPGGGLFDWLGNLFPKAPGSFPGVGLYRDGGFTGPGRPDEAAGVVHRGEYVFDAAATRRIGVGALEAIRRGRMPGYEAGGLVGASGGGGTQGERPMRVEIHDHAGTEKRVERRRDGNGEDVLQVVIDKVDGEIGGGRFDRTFGARYGAKPRAARR